MPVLSRHKRHWEDLGELDPFFAVLSDPNCKFGKWDVDEFFATGTREIAQLMDSIAQWGLPRERELALDFGCGVGRLTRALASQFQQSYGVDISASMVQRAQELNRHVPGCKFFVNATPRLPMFTDGSFDMIYTTMVLQHIPNRSVIRSYLTEFVRVLKEGGLLVFQLPSYIPLRGRHQLPSRLYSLLRLVGFGKQFLYAKLGLWPVRMNFIPEEQVVAHLKTVGGKIVEIRPNSMAGATIQSRMYFVTK